MTAEHLYGLSGECAVKAALLKFGVKKEQVGKDGDFSGHLPHLLTKVINEPITNRGRSRIPTDFALNISDIKSYFKDFSMSRRYFHRDDVTGDVVKTFKASVKKLRGVCDRALLQGEGRLGS